MDTAVESIETPHLPNQDLLYRHEKRENWGVAVFLWERDGKRAFRFADGETRVFKQGFYELMVPTTPPADGSADELRAKVRAHASGKKDAIVPTVGDQLVLLLKDYPKGFAGEAWQTTHRGGGRRLKRHRDAAIRRARELLGPESLRQAHAAGNYQAALDALVKLLTETDLAPGAHIRKLQEAQATEELSELLIRFAADSEAATVRELQAALERARGPATSWQILTAPLALLAPHTHLCVRPSVFATQGTIVMPHTFTAPKRANEAGYQRYLEIARLVTEELEALGHPPRDLLDIHDFAWVTLRPAARDELERIHIAAQSKQAAKQDA